MDRRTFLAAAAVLTGKSPKTTLAADGGKPVRAHATPCRAFLAQRVTTTKSYSS